MDRFVSQSHDLITRAGRRLVGVSVLPLFIIRADGGHVEVSALCYFFFFRIVLNMQASIACVLGLSTCHLKRGQNWTTFEPNQTNIDYYLYKCLGGNVI